MLFAHMDSLRGKSPQYGCHVCRSCTMSWSSIQTQAQQWETLCMSSRTLPCLHQGDVSMLSSSCPSWSWQARWEMLSKGSTCGKNNLQMQNSWHVTWIMRSFGNVNMPSVMVWKQLNLRYIPEVNNYIYKGICAQLLQRRLLSSTTFIIWDSSTELAILYSYDKI